MTRRSLELILLRDRFAVVKLHCGSPIPDWALNGQFYSVTRTSDELSVVCDESRVPEPLAREGGWRCLRIAGQIAFSAVGVLASLTEPLAAAGIGVFAISTFDTDYLLVKQTDLDRAIEALTQYGHTVRP